MGNLYPTDIDGLLEYRDSEYILFEIKHGSAKTPIGQKLALQRMVNDFTKIGKRAIAIICEHCVHDCNKPIVASRCWVREVYYGEEGKWRNPKETITLGEAVRMFQESVEELNKASERNEGRI